MSSSTFDDSDIDLDSIAEESRSDVDSLYDELSSDTEHLYNATATSAAAQATKAIEFAQDSDDTPGISTSPPPFVPSPQYGWNEPILDAGPAPPDYAAATSSRRLQSEGHVFESMSVESPMNNGLFDSAHRFRPFSFLRIFSGGKKQRMQRLRLLLLILLLLSITFTLLIRRTSRPTKSLMPYQHSDTPDNMKSICEFDRHIGWVDIPFEDPTSFSLIEDIKYVTCGPDFKNCTLGGHINVVHIPPKSETIPLGIPIMARISVATAFPHNIDRLNYVKSQDSLILKKPELSERKREPIDAWKWDNLYRPGGSIPCLHFVMRIYVRKNVTLTDWVTKMRHFSFSVSEEEDPDYPDHLYCATPPVQITNTTFHQNHYGESSWLMWNSRKTHLESRTGLIHGQFLFVDDLTIENWSGSIRADVDDWDMNLPRPKDTKRTLSTITRSGNTTINHWERWNKLDSAFLHKDDPLPRVFASHHSTSGKIALKYPAGWAGSMEGLSVYGNIKLRGGTPEADIEQRGDSAYISETIGDASEDAGSVHFSTETGDVDIAVSDGKDWVQEHIVMGYYAS